MSYFMEQQDSRFCILSKNVEPARQAICHVMDSYDWFDTNDIESLSDAVSQFGWGIVLDDSGNVTDIAQWIDNMNEENLLFTALAPFVVSESYIQMVGEDTKMWRWVFDGVCCKKITPKIEW